MVESLLPGHELTHLQPYTWYVISARPHTLEGEGKESEGILAITGEDGKKHYSSNHRQQQQYSYIMFSGHTFLALNIYLL